MNLQCDIRSVVHWTVSLLTKSSVQRESVRTRPVPNFAHFQSQGTCYMYCHLLLCLEVQISTAIPIGFVCKSFLLPLPPAFYFPAQRGLNPRIELAMYCQIHLLSPAQEENIR